MNTQQGEEYWSFITKITQYKILLLNTTMSWWSRLWSDISVASDEENRCYSDITLLDHYRKLTKSTA